ncbi:MAG: 2-phospho-L-lactate guanylyltransferase [Dehalococcoidia bacterium]|nr:2-phospho-L-lactate guanylyltransferase [Dehalococcoidia bacterium]
MAQRILAVVPMKPLDSAKSRLAPSLSERQRTAIAVRLLKTVLSAATACPSVSRTCVVGGDARVQEAAAAIGAAWEDDGGADLNTVLDAAFGRWFHQGGDAALFLPADLPLVERGDLGRLVEASGGLRAVVLAPAARDGGTNAVLMPRTLRFPFRLGPGGSYERHLRQAKGLGYPVARYAGEAVGLDVDTLDDLNRWRSLHPEAFAGPEAWDLAQSPSDKAFDPTAGKSPDG